MGKSIINTDLIKKSVELLCEQANYHLPKDVFDELQTVYSGEDSEIARASLYEILTNAYLASTSKRPICQDTGLVAVFIDIGQDVSLEGQYLNDAINDGIEEAYRKGVMRKSIVNDPLFERKNTTTNTPGIIHSRVVPGKEVKIIVAPKGGGSENMSALKMLKPSDGVNGVIDFVIDTVKNAGANPCPPINVGIGIGGTMEQAAILSKRALLNKIIPVEELKEKAKNDKKADLELQILEKINKLGIGAQGLGGNKTAFNVSIEMLPCHIASLPVAININCHAARHAEITLTENTKLPEQLDAEFDMVITKQIETALKPKKITLPLTDEDANDLKAGDYVLMSGFIYTGRDAAHKRLVECLNNNQELPINIKGETIYYVGPCPAKEGEIIGPAGPTTSGRMDKYAPLLMEKGLKGMIGKGDRNQEVIQSIIKNKATYFVATGGAGALLATKIKQAEVVAYPDLGPEAIYKLKIEDFPVIVCIDSMGNNYYEIGRSKYQSL